MFKVIIVAVLAAAGFVAYKLWKSGKAVTTRNVVAGVKEEAVKVAVKAEKVVVKAKQKLKK